MLPRSLTSLFLWDVCVWTPPYADDAWANVPSGLQLRTLELPESSLPSPSLNAWLLSPTFVSGLISAMSPAILTILGILA